MVTFRFLQRSQALQTLLEAELSDVGSGIMAPSHGQNYDRRLQPWIIEALNSVHAENRTINLGSLSCAVTAFRQLLVSQATAWDPHNPVGIPAANYRICGIWLDGPQFQLMGRDVSWTKAVVARHLPAAVGEFPGQLP